MIYVYKCPKCDAEYEEYFSIGMAGETVCPNCGCIGTRVFTSSGFKINIQEPFFSYQTGTMVKNKAEEEHKLQQLDMVN